MEHGGIWHDSDATASCGGVLRCSDTPAGSVISQYTQVPAATAPEWPVCQWLPRRADGCGTAPCQRRTGGGGPWRPRGGARPICARHALLVGSVTRDRGTLHPGLAAHASAIKEEPRMTDQRSNWLRVFRNPGASRTGHRRRQQQHTRAVWPEKCGELRGTAWHKMQVITEFFGSGARAALPGHRAAFFSSFKELARFTKLATS